MDFFWLQRYKYFYKTKTKRKSFEVFFTTKNTIDNQYFVNFVQILCEPCGKKGTDYDVAKHLIIRYKMQICASRTKRCIFILEI